MAQMGNERPAEEEEETPLFDEVFLSCGALRAGVTQHPWAEPGCVIWEPLEL